MLASAEKGVRDVLLRLHGRRQGRVERHDLLKFVEHHNDESIALSSEVFGQVQELLDRPILVLLESHWPGLDTRRTILAQGQPWLARHRAEQLESAGAAILSPAALTLVTSLFRDGRERHRALGIYGAVGAGGFAIGVFLAGLLTDGPRWRWVCICR